MKKFFTRTRSLSALVLSLAFLFVSAKTEKTTLQYNLTIGSTYKLKTVANQVIEQSMMGQTQTIKNHIEGLMSFQVKGIDSNIYTIDTWYENLKMVMETPMGKQEMDSEKPAEGNEGAAMFGKLINKHFTIKMTRSGEITEINSDGLLDEVLLGMDEVKAATAKETLKQFLGKEGLKSSIEMITKYYPEQAVNVGDTWEKNSEMPSPLSANVVTSWKLVSSQDGILNIEGSGTIKSKENAPFVTMNGFPMKFDISGEQQVTSKVNQKSGWTIEATVNSEIRGKIIVDASSQGAGNMEIPMTIFSKTIISGSY